MCDAIYWLTALLLAVLSFILGWLIGRKGSRGDLDEFSVDEHSWLVEDVTQNDSDSTDEVDMKLVLLVRTDLSMTKGKVCAQCGHAAVKACQVAHKHAPRKLRSWLSQGQKKITLKVNEDELHKLLDKARQSGIICGKIKDAGHTQVDPNTLTVGFLGPWDEADLDAISGALKLY